MNLAHGQVFEIMNLQEEEEEEEEEDCAKLTSCFRILTCKIPLLLLLSNLTQGFACSMFRGSHEINGEP
jgi:hypothetical protein